MKVFDFSTGTKGRELATIKCAGQLGGCLTTDGDKTYRVRLANAQDGWTFHFNASYYMDGADVQILPENFGVEAICFCIGEIFHTWHKGHPEAESAWEWVVIGTSGWTSRAIETEILNTEILT